MEDLKWFSSAVVTLLYSTLLDDLPVKGSILLDFYICGTFVKHQDTTHKGFYSTRKVQAELEKYHYFISPL